MYECVALVGVLPSRVHAYTYLHTPSGGKERGGDRKEISVLLTASSERASERHERERERARSKPRRLAIGAYTLHYTPIVFSDFRSTGEKEREKGSFAVPARRALSWLILCASSQRLRVYGAIARGLRNTDTHIDMYMDVYLRVYTRKR